MVDVRVVHSVKELLSMAPRADPIGMVLLSMSEPAMIKYAEESRLMIPFKSLNKNVVVGIFDITKSVSRHYISELSTAYSGVVPIKAVLDNRNNITGFVIGHTIRIALSRSEGPFPLISMYYCPANAEIRRGLPQGTDCVIIDHNEFIRGADIGPEPDSRKYALVVTWDRNMVYYHESQGWRSVYSEHLSSLVNTIRSQTDEMALRAELIKLYGSLFTAVYVDNPHMLAFVSSINLDVGDRAMLIKYVITSYTMHGLNDTVTNAVMKIMDNEILTLISKLAMGRQPSS